MINSAKKGSEDKGPGHSLALSFAQSPPLSCSSCRRRAHPSPINRCQQAKQRPGAAAAALGRNFLPTQLSLAVRPTVSYLNGPWGLAAFDQPDMNATAAAVLSSFFTNESR